MRDGNHQALRRVAMSIGGMAAVDRLAWMLG
jgi:hypothetical protein